jgi:hypothetical protein
MKLTTFLAATLLTTTAAAQTRDHHSGGGNPADISRASYRAADDAEAMASQARYGCYNGQGAQLSASANRMHLALSDLYYAARRAAGGQRTAELRDHNQGGDLGGLFEIVASDYNQVQIDYNYVGFNCNASVQNLYRSLQYDYSYLAQVMDAPHG